MSKILFLHVPKSVAKPAIMFIPLGVVALANFLKENEHDVKIVNAYVEKKLNKKFDAVKFVKKNKYKVICMSLHWHFQAYDVLETAKKIKKQVPDAKIILGGFTATYFAEEILKNYKNIDFIVRGDAELPLLDLVEERKLEEIPNLAWRKGKKVVLNKQDYQLTPKMMNSLSYTDFSLISHLEEYQKLGLPEKDKENKWLFVYNPGVGCNVNCSFCGGGCDSQKRLNGRSKAFFVDLEKAVSELKNLANHSMGVWCCAFDPDKSDYYPNLFRRLRKERVKVRCKFEAWKLPTKEFIDEFAKTFTKGSEILISPNSGSPKVRKLNNGFYYSNKELAETISYMEKKNVKARVYFTAGLPGETIDDFIKTLSMINTIRTKCKISMTHSVPVEIEPASPLYVDKSKYNVKSSRKTFKDFFDAHKKKSDIGYSTEYFSEADIPELVNLARAAGECVMKRPVFLKAMQEAPFSFDKFPKNEIWRFCTICKFFNRCFA